MNLRLICLLLLVPSVLSARPGLPADEPLPRLLYWDRAHYEFPMWVGAEEAFTPTGQPNTEHFHPYTADTIRSLLAMPAKDGCILIEEAYDQPINPPDRPNPTAATKTSELVVVGTVTGRAYGFQGSVPGQLLRVDIDERIKGPREKLDSYYVFLPVGSFKAGGRRICKTDRRYANTPEIGEQVILFVPKGRRLGKEYVNIFDESGLITLNSDGTASLPGRFRRNLRLKGPVTSASLLEVVRGAAQTEVPE